MNTWFFTLASFLLISVSLINPLYYKASEIRPTELTFIVVFEGSNTKYELDTLSLQCLIILKLHGDRVEITLKNLAIENLPSITMYTGRAEFIRMLANEWVDSIELFRKIGNNTGLKTYVSVNGEIVEAFIFEETNGKSFRDPNTGLFLGGYHIFLLKFKRHDYETIYRIESTSYLIMVKPDSLMKNLNVVNINTVLVTIVCLVFSIIISFNAIKTIIRHNEYEIV